MIEIESVRSGIVFHENIPFLESVRFALNQVALACLKPLHRSSTCLIHSFCTPIRPREFGNADTKTKEIVYRILGVAFSFFIFPLSFLGYALSGTVDLVADRLFSKPYTRLLGNLRPSTSHEFPKLLTLNACMLYGGLPILFGGVRPAHERIDALALFILEKNPDLLFLQEMSFESALLLWEKIKHQYSYGFTRIGAGYWHNLDTGLFVASKRLLTKEPKFVSLSYQGAIKRGLFCLETLQHRLFTSHLQAGDSASDRQVRQKELSEIVEVMKQEGTGKPSFLIGDLNINRQDGMDDEYRNSIIPKYFDNFFNPTISEESATCTNRLNDYARGKAYFEGGSSEHIDYVLSLKESYKGRLKASLTSAFDLKNPGKALSDHNALEVS